MGYTQYNTLYEAKNHSYTEYGLSLLCINYMWLGIKTMVKYTFICRRGGKTTYVIPPLLNK